MDLIVFAHGGGRGKPMTPEQCMLAAYILFAFALWCGLSGLHPRLRGKARWGRRGGGGPISIVGQLGWAGCFAMWGIAMLGHGLQFQPLKDQTVTLMVLGFAGLTGSAIFDSYRNQRRALINPSRRDR
jgi:hypothetical protein